MRLNAALVAVLVALALFGWLSAPLGLAAGLALGLGLGNPWPGSLSRISKYLLQAAVVGLGFGVTLGEVWEAGRDGVIFTVVGISATLLAGRALGRLLRVPDRTAALVTFGTAICGGSAIAAMAPVLDARDEEIGASLATVFSLNAVALFVFPPLGHLFGLTQEQFGFWAALAIHDTSSVVAAGSVYGATALGIATTVKLARAVWIAPITFGAAWFRRRQGPVAIPWFILGFLLAAALRALAAGLRVALARRGDRREADPGGDARPHRRGDDTRRARAGGAPTSRARARALGAGRRRHAPAGRRPFLRFLTPPDPATAETIP